MVWQVLRTIRTSNWSIFATTQFVRARVLFASELISGFPGSESACKVATEATIMELEHSSSCQSPDLVENVLSYWQ